MDINEAKAFFEQREAEGIKAKMAELSIADRLGFLRLKIIKRGSESERLCYFLGAAYAIAKIQAGATPAEVKKDLTEQWQSFEI